VLAFTRTDHATTAAAGILRSARACRARIRIAGTRAAAASSAVRSARARVRGHAGIRDWTGAGLACARFAGCACCTRLTRARVGHHAAARHALAARVAHEAARAIHVRAARLAAAVRAAHVRFARRVAGGQAIPLTVAERRVRLNPVDARRGATSVLRGREAARVRVAEAQAPARAGAGARRATAVRELVVHRVAATGLTLVTLQVARFTLAVARARAAEAIHAVRERALCVRAAARSDRERGHAPTARAPVARPALCVRGARAGARAADRARARARQARLLLCHWAATVPGAIRCQRRDVAGATTSATERLLVGIGAAFLVRAVTLTLASRAVGRARGARAVRSAGHRGARAFVSGHVAGFALRAAGRVAAVAVHTRARDARARARTFFSRPELRHALPGRTERTETTVLVDAAVRRARATVTSASGASLRVGRGTTAASVAERAHRRDALVAARSSARSADAGVDASGAGGSVTRAAAE